MKRATSVPKKETIVGLGWVKLLMFDQVYKKNIIHIYDCKYVCYGNIFHDECNSIYLVRL